MNRPARYKFTDGPFYLAKALGGSGVWIGISPEDFDAQGFVSVFEFGDSEASEAAALRGFHGEWISASEPLPNR